MSGNWVANGLSQDLPAGGVMPGRWQDTELAIWRAGSGQLSAWKDRCPHRGMRLSHGFVRGDTLSCIYHGWAYGTNGTCGRIPAHPAMQPPASIRAESFRILEQDGLIWVGPATAIATLADTPPAVGAMVGAMVGARSLAVSARPAHLAAASGLATVAPDVLRGALALGGRQIDLCLVLQPKPGATGVHALTPAASDRVAVSRWLESLRRVVEEAEAA